MKLTEVKLPAWIGRDRYFLIDLDGKASIHGYIQRPTAERRARQSGQGLYDKREQALIVQPDVELRLRHHRDNVVRQKEELNEAVQRLMAIEEAAEKEREHA